MNPDKITQEVVKGNLQLEMVLKEMAFNMGTPFTTGNVYFVVPTTNSNYVQFHKNHQKKYSDGTEMIQTSLANAITASTASRGDVIFLAPGFSLAVTSSNVAISKAGLTIIGLGNGSLKPTFTFGATNSAINVTAANCTLQNVRLQAGIGDVVTAVLHATAAQNTRYIDIEFYATSTFNFINGYDSVTFFL